MQPEDASKAPPATNPYRQGMSAYHRGDHATAARCLEAAAQRDGAEAVLARFYGGQAYYQLGLAELRRRKFAGAIEHFKKAMGFNPKTEGLAKFLGACYAAVGDLDRAGQHFEKLLHADSKADDVRIRMALIQWKSGKYDAAMDTLREGVRISPDEPELQYQLGILLGASEQYGEAVDALTVAHRLRPKHADTCVKLGWCEGARGKVQTAYDHLAQAHGLEPCDAAIAMQMTMAAQAVVQNGGHVQTDPIAAVSNEGIDDEGVDVLGEMIAQNSDFAEAMLSLEESDLDREVFSVIVRAIQAALARHPEYADLHYHCSRVHERLGNTDQAIDASERALRINPRFVKALVQLGRLYTETDQQSDAISRLEQAIEAGGAYSDIYFMLGNLYRDAGKTDRAKTAYESALALNEDYTAASVALAGLAA